MMTKAELCLELEAAMHTARAADQAYRIAVADLRESENRCRAARDAASAASDAVKVCYDLWQEAVLGEVKP